MATEIAIGGVVLIVLVALFLKRSVRLDFSKKGVSLHIDAPVSFRSKRKRSQITDTCQT